MYTFLSMYTFLTMYTHSSDNFYHDYNALGGKQVSNFHELLELIEDYNDKSSFKLSDSIYNLIFSDSLPQSIDESNEQLIQNIMGL